MIIEIGHFALLLALFVACVQMIVPFWGAQTGDIRMMRIAEPAAITQFMLILVSFLALMYAYVVSDFSVLNVFQNSHSTKPLIYRISGVWGNHEGSMILWVLILAIFGAAVAVFGTNLPQRLRANVLAVQGSIGVAFLTFIVLTSNPFLRLNPAPMDGKGLNPILQDLALSFHPPFLYLGYVGLSMAFSFAVAALIEGRIDAAWARWVRPWTLLAWMCLTLGISMGSWWAYYELGWGGWWFWDPVENSSFMPWLASTALLHSALVMEKREALKVWTILLAILAFSLSLMGTFLVRSGVLSSVHAFAVDPARGTFVLGIMVIFIGGALTLFAVRASELRQGGLFAPISREGGLVLNNLLLTVACATVLVGTLQPLVAELYGFKISVGAPYFNMTFVPLMIPLLLAMPFGPFLAWKRGDIGAALQRLMVAGAVSLSVIVLVFAYMRGGPWLAPFALAIGVWVVAGALSDLAFRVKLFTAPGAESWRRARNLPRSVYGSVASHLGMGLTVIGIVGTTAWRSEVVTTVLPGESVKIAGYELLFQGVTKNQGPNYRERVGLFNVSYDGAKVVDLKPSQRVYDAPPQPTTEAGIFNAWGGDLYVVIEAEPRKGKHVVRAYFNPLVRLIWIGTLVMFLGGGLSLSDRRLRVGAPKRARKMPAGVPAE